ncbi:UPF0175 family protein [Thermococcus sp. 101 C5]|nr:UPF0175 family protein [Thermococcus sp. 101 C5]
MYQRGVLSLGKAAKLAGVTKREFLEELAKRRFNSSDPSCQDWQT